MTILAVLFATYFNFGGRTLNLGFNIGCAAVLAEYFHRKYFPDEAAYETRKIWKPLIIGIAIVITMTLLAIWAMDQAVQ